MRRQGHATRGKTAPERLRRTDTFVALDGVLRRVPPRYVDVGYGADATTVRETTTRLRRHRVELEVIGIEIDRARVEVAAADVAADWPDRRPPRFAHGGFEAVAAHAPVGVVRAMNVLRQYDEDEHGPAIATMGAALAPGGLLIEGTSSPSGRLLVVNIVRRGADGLRFDGLLLAPNPRRRWDPLELRTVLPKNLIHHCEPGSALDAFFAGFDRAVREGRDRRLATPALGAHVAARLTADGRRVDPRPALLRRGLWLVHELVDPRSGRPSTS